MYCIRLIATAPKNPARRLFASNKTLGVVFERRLLKGNTQRLRRTTLRFGGRLLLHQLFAFLGLAPRGENQLLLIQRSDKTVPRREFNNVRVTHLLRAVEHVLLHRFAKFSAAVVEIGDIDRFLDFVVASRDNARPVFKVSHAEFHAKRHTLELPVVVLPARRVIVARIELCAHAGSLERISHFLRGIIHFLLHFVRDFAIGDRNNDSLDWSNLGWQHKAVVVAVHHVAHAERSRRETPRVLPHHRSPTLLIFVFDVEHLGKVLSQAVRGRTLHTAAGTRYVRLNRSRVQAARKLFLFRFFTRDDRNGQVFFIHTAVQI
mmetsp:Transcript_7560/g.27636  ORF Transcript_7560/g.27636 Transcript_7560/m.27636 type:complete len:319 (-) Transcript_7560:1399-2355(-)